MADIDPADPTAHAPPLAPPPGDGDTPASAASPDGEGSKGPTAPKVTRRAALGVLGGGVVASAGLLTGRRVLLADETAASKRVQPAAPSSTGGTDPAAPTTEAPTTAPPNQFPLWSDPATWGGKVPGAGDLATVTQPVLLDVDAEVAGVVVEPAGQLIFDPDKSHTLTSSANVVVKGVLKMRPSSAGVLQVLAFTGIDEGGFVGGDTHTTIDSDVGVWVTEAGVLDAFGTAKTAWTHLTAAGNSGAGSIEVEAADGWQVGDEIVVTPTGEFDYGEHWQHHDRRKISAISGTRVTLDQKLDYDHPFVTVRDGVTHRPEVLNLSRNVRIQGEEDARAHVIFLHGTKPQKLGWLGLRHLGPRDVLGRYSLHVHMGYDAVKGSTVEGAVAYDTGNHAFVPHLSNGVAFTDCVVHDSVKDAFWWDPAGEGQEAGDVPSDDILWDRCVASFVDHGEGEEAHSNSGFMMGAGARNIARNCVAVGIRGKSEGSTGFQWNAGSNDETNPWIFEDNLAHNNTHSALFYWQNNAPKTIVDRFTAYNCGQGIYAGSYMNLISYRDCNVYRCADWGLNVRATPPGVQGETITYDNIYIDAAGMSDYAVKIEEHTLSDDKVTVFTNCIFKGAKEAQVGFPTGGELRQMYDFVDCTFEGNAFYLAEGVPADSQIRVQGGTLGSLNVHPPGGPGEPKAEWNGSVTPA
jgi:hypothetical protein